MSESERIAEKNARAGARGVYIRWLAERFGTLDLMLTRKGEDRVSLRRIYVPVRVDTEDRPDESLGGPDTAKDEQPPGRDALELIAESRFVAISGRPGSGKTTLVQALLGILTSGDPSPVQQRLAGERGILPIPLILRDYQDQLDAVTTLDDLLRLWWSHAADEAAATGFALDLPRLFDSYARAARHRGDAMPLLVLFDGLDEVGGPITRQRIFDIAATKDVRVRCALVTGRPDGLADLDFGGIGSGNRLQPDLFSDDQLRPHYLQPFAFPQIRDFITRFLRLRQEWQVEARRLLEEFDAALQDSRRPHLINLARRPIFLTLMALVHVNERHMPHGRADLYEKIVDLYLNRQMQAKRLQHTLNDEPMPHWDQKEVRRALGYLAWRSQHRDAERGERGDRERRQVVWTRGEMEGELSTLLAGETNDKQPFSDLTPTDAPQLLDYYLHPAGLLVDPAEGRYQFAHLSFQEFLCAEYIHGRAKARGSRRFLDGIHELLLKHLARPGWDEVGMLLLCIHSVEGAQAEPDAHLEILAELNLADGPQARLLVDALTGRELDYSGDELVRWLPLAVAAALAHPNASLAERFGRVRCWSGLGLALLRRLFAAESPLDVLTDRLREAPPGRRLGLDGDEAAALLQGPAGRWGELGKALGREPPLDDAAARDYALLRLVNDSGWVPKDPERPNWLPIADPALERSLADWLVRMPEDGECGRLYRRWRSSRDCPRLPVPSAASFELDVLAMPRGPLWASLALRVPMDLWLLQCEVADDRLGYLWPQSAVTLSLYPDPICEVLPGVWVVAVTSFQSMLIAESLYGGPEFARYASWRLRSLSRSVSRSQSQSHGRSRSRAQLLRHSRSRLRSVSRSLSMSLPFETSLLLPRSLSLLMPGVMSLRLSPRSKSALIRAENEIKEVRQQDRTRFAKGLQMFGYRFAAHDWFAEQSEDPDLMRRRGLRPGEPLPREFGLFEPDGRLRDTMPREGLVRLRAWLADDDAILAWVFPEGLCEADEQHLRAELHTLHHYERPDGGHGQPWSPLAAIDAALSDWPKDQPTRDVSLAAAERDLLAVLDALFPEKSEPKQPEQ